MTTIPQPDAFSPALSISPSQRRTALVTGGARGIGRAIVCALARNGYDVVINYHRAGKPHLDALRRELDGVDVMASFVRADVTNERDIDYLVMHVHERFGRLDLLVNNAGVLLRQGFTELTAGNFDTHIAMNLRAPVLLTKLVLPLLLKSGRGRVIMVSSTSAYSYTKGSDIFSYAVSKAGLLGVTRGLALELAPSILVNCVVPAYIETDMFVNGASPAELEARRGRTMLHRFGTPEEVGGLVAFLASADADFITGQAFHINGGRYLGL